ncbi:MAG: ATP-binding protein [Geminicoccaceae bacterium]
MTDLLELARERSDGDGYTAHDIEVWRALSRSGGGRAYVGGTDKRALHHLVAEVLDNATGQAVAGHTTRIELELAAPDRITVRDNGYGIPTRTPSSRTRAPSR